MNDFIGHFTSSGINSPDSYHAITPARVDICPPIVSVKEKHSKHKNFNFSFLLFTTTTTLFTGIKEGTQTSVIESSAGDIKKLMASAAPESTKKVTKIRC